MFVAGLLPALAGLGGLALYARSRLARNLPETAPAELA
jgi:hypothetical protein